VDPTATIETDPGTLSEILWHGRPLADAVESNAVVVEGDMSALGRFPRLFPLPGLAS
jgi:hypothetical protein